MTRELRDEGDKQYANRLSWIEAISFTLALIFVGALAAGWLDGLVTW